MPAPIRTHDGSHTLLHPQLLEHYHSIHGAIAESMHVFIEYGVMEVSAIPIHILEIGMGTALNALLTRIEADKNCRQTYYTTLEPFPISNQTASTLNYASQLNVSHHDFMILHHSSWETMHTFSPFFHFIKIKSTIQQYNADSKFNLIYFDAFSPDKMPEMWTEDVFEKILQMLHPGGIMVTYCAKGSVRRLLMRVGFEVIKKPGPPGKREMTLAIKKNSN